MCNGTISVNPSGLNANDPKFEFGESSFVSNAFTSGGKRVTDVTSISKSPHFKKIWK